MTQEHENATPQDHWVTAESLEEAQEKYNNLISKSYVYSVSITAVVESTDYPTPAELEAEMTGE